MNRLMIISRSEEVFTDRQEAGGLLGLSLKRLHGPNVVVLGIPRGGVVIADRIAHILDADMDIVLARKLCAPDNSELAIGSITEGGKVFLNDQIVDEVGLPTYFSFEKERELTIMKQRKLLFRTIYPKVSLKGKIVVVTDDGAATGATMQAAVWSARQEKPKRIIVALPIAPEETLRKLTVDADEVVCLRVPQSLGAVSHYYSNFRQVEDEDVIDILKRSAHRHHLV